MLSILIYNLISSVLHSNQDDLSTSIRAKHKVPQMLHKVFPNEPNLVSRFHLCKIMWHTDLKRNEGRMKWHTFLMTFNLFKVINKEDIRRRKKSIYCSIKPKSYFQHKHKSVFDQNDDKNIWRFAVFLFMEPQWLWNLLLSSI